MCKYMDIVLRKCITKVQNDSCHDVLMGNCVNCVAHQVDQVKEEGAALLFS